MPTKTEVERLRQYLQQEGMALKERSVAEELLKAAESGDKAAFNRIEQVARERGFQPLPGDDDALPPGPLYVCPVDPSHYRAYQREVGQDLVCPEHEVPLRPAKGKE
jgi:predicted component of type VI protein secretion system